MKRKLILAFVFLFAIALFTGCKSDVSREESSQSETKLDTTVIDNILERGYLTVGCSEESTSLFEYDEKNGKYSGLEADIAYETAAEIFGVTAEKAEKDGLVEFVPVTSENRESLVLWGNFDVLLANYTITSERKQTLSFSDSYYTDYLAVLVSKESKLSNVSDLTNKNVGVVRSTTSEDNLKTYFSSLEKNKDYPFFFEYADLDAAVAALKDNVVSAVCCDENLISEYAVDGYELLDEKVVGQHYGAAVKPENELLLDYVNTSIAKCIK